MKNLSIFALIVASLVSNSALAVDKTSYYESPASMHDDYIVVTMQSNEYRSYKLCNRIYFMAGTLNLNDPAHCTQIGKRSYEYLNPSMVLYKKQLAEETASASRKSLASWSLAWTSIAVPVAKTIYQAISLGEQPQIKRFSNEYGRNNYPNMGEVVNHNKLWLLSGAILAAVTGYYGEVQGEIARNGEITLKTLSPALAPVLDSQTTTIDMNAKEYAKRLNEVLISLEAQNLIKGQGTN